LPIARSSKYNFDCSAPAERSQAHAALGWSVELALRR
jgi:hypothetical protein